MIQPEIHFHYKASIYHSKSLSHEQYILMQPGSSPCVLRMATYIQHHLRFFSTNFFMRKESC